MTWSETFLTVLKKNDIKLVTYVPDNVLTPLIKGVGDDPYFNSVVATREDEALGIVAGAWMAGLRGVVLMQTSGFAVLPKRWIVERTIAWLNRCRRLAKDWECLNRKALAFLRLASIRLMLRKLCNPA